MKSYRAISVDEEIRERIVNMDGVYNYHFWGIQIEGDFWTKLLKIGTVRSFYG